MNERTGSVKVCAMSIIGAITPTSVDSVASQSLSDLFTSSSPRWFGKNRLVNSAVAVLVVTGGSCSLAPGTYILSWW